jgi:hypothetical protein
MFALAAGLVLGDVAVLARANHLAGLGCRSMRIVRTVSSRSGSRLASAQTRGMVAMSGV